MRGISVSSTSIVSKRGGLMALLCACLLAAGCSESKQDDGKFDASRLPRVSGAKVIFANAEVTNFTSPTTVAQTADDLDKILSGAGWQKFVAPNTAYVNDPMMRTMSLKKGPFGLTVFIGVAPAQNNSTSVQYSALPLKTDLPFIKDAASIEYSPDRALLSLITAEPLDKTLDFYRKELGALGWSLWSEKTNGKQAPDGPSGIVHERGAYAHYITDRDPSVAMVLTLQKAEGGKSKLELKALPVSVLASLHQSYLNSDNAHTPMVDVRQLPRLSGAQEQAAAADKVAYSIRSTLADTTAALKTLLAADGWKNYVVPLDERSSLLAFKKAGQGLAVSFTIEVGKNERTSEVTTVHYSPARLQYALAIPDDASDVVYDQYRPYLSAIAGGNVERNLDFFQKQLGSSGWQRVSASDILKQWPNASIGSGSRGETVYFNRGAQRPVIMLTLERRDGDKVQAEIRVPPFAQPQDLEKGEDIFGLPRPKVTRNAGGTGGSLKEMHASVPADIGAVLAFYRRELSSRGWKEETQGAAINPDDVSLNFTPADGGTAILKLERKYDMTVVSLVHELPKPAARPSAPAADNSIDSVMKQAQQMMRDAGVPADMLAPKAPAPSGAVEVLRPLANSGAPVPLPESAENIDAANGRLQFSTSSSVQSVADFYRSTMRQQGWASQTSVINNANMVVLNFAKGGQTAMFTIMKMGNQTNVSADGSAFKEVAAKPAARPVPSANAASADKPSPPATDDDLIAEESSGLPIPKRRTMSEGSKTPFRRELTANVPLDLSVVLGFYRRELSKLNWKEESNGAVVAPDNVKLAFSSSEGNAALTLGRKNGETIVSLVARYPDAAAKAGIVAKPGQAKLLVSNPGDVEAAVTINRQTVKVAAGAGMKGPDGATLDLPPGKYKVSTKLPGKPASEDEIEVGANQTWGILVGPGGVLPMQVY